MYLVTVLLILTITMYGKTFSYNGYKVYQIEPEGEEEMSILQEFSNNSHFDFWSPLNLLGTPIDVMVSPKSQLHFEDVLDSNEIQYDTIINNVASLIKDEKPLRVGARFQEDDINFDNYYRHEEINSYLRRLKNSYPNIVHLETIGRSYEGRDLLLIKISSNLNANNTIIFIDAGIHAREWIAPATALYIIQQLVEMGDQNNMYEKIDWHILPVANPDGYEYSQIRKRFWRKTRSPTPRKKCIGTDPNRNFNFHWSENEISGQACSDTYEGPYAFSENETRAIARHLFKHKKSIKLYLSFHSYGKYILYPWGYTSDLPSDADELQSVGEAVANAIRKFSGTVYTVGSSTRVLYSAAGGSDDWAKGVAGIQLAYTIELPGGGKHGFNPAPSEIFDIVSETWEGVKEFYNYIWYKFVE